MYMMVGIGSTRWEMMLGYGYRSMSQEEKKGYAMEATFDDVGCGLTLFAGDAWHCHSFKITFQELSAWKRSGKHHENLAWLRSEFVRQVLEQDAQADLMPHGGPRDWTDAMSLTWGPVPFLIFLQKLAAEDGHPNEVS